MLNSEFVHCMRTAFNTFMPNGISHRYQLKQSISVLRDVKWYFFIFMQIFIENLERAVDRAPSQIPSLKFFTSPSPIPGHKPGNRIKILFNMLFIF